MKRLDKLEAALKQIYLAEQGRMGDELDEVKDIAFKALALD